MLRKLAYVLIWLSSLHWQIFAQLPRSSDIEFGTENKDEAIKEIRQKWGTKSDIVHNLEHIKADVDKVMHLQETGELGAHEALFYFFRMHDFDDNGKLDGHEMMAALRHTMDENQLVQENDLIPMVDGFMELDDDHDGYLTYSELRKNLGEGLTPKI